MPAPLDTRPLRAWMHRRLAPRTTFLVSAAWLIAFPAVAAAAVVYQRAWAMAFAVFWLVGCLAAAGALYDLAVWHFSPADDGRGTKPPGGQGNRKRKLKNPTTRRRPPARPSR
ncbi:hypothetical protein AB0I28_31190 [Phytomonospora sp. NPDC050363]|uniref:hypothetical protein n=1 Tax=Phytomonospora sp. NPDC050363 TaxID=3155642 RepID=UPI0033EA5FD5